MAINDGFSVSLATAKSRGHASTAIRQVLDDVLENRGVIRLFAHQTSIALPFLTTLWWLDIKHQQFRRRQSENLFESFFIPFF